ncbi:MAG: hypothetical protein E7013_03090 [Alphaproteobacteria bacterium]|nr:hypothetical protein [Alphaproteobacteria bacterium]
MQKNKKEKIQKEKPAELVIEQPKEQDRSILKPFAVFAVFVACIGGAVLYPYFNKKDIIFPPVKKVQASNTTSLQQPPSDALILYDVQEKQMDNSVPQIIHSMEESCATKDKLILNQKQTIDGLNEKLHRLEMENFNLSEKMTNWDKIVPLTAQLLNEISTGKPFLTTLNLLLTHDKTNVLALNVQEKLSDLATSGIPTQEDLKNDFLKIMDIAKKSFYISKENTSWNKKTTAYFKSLFFIYPEKIDAQKAHGIDLLFLAKEQVMDNQFALAIKTIEKLPSNVQNLFNGFVKNAKSYLLAQQIINAYLKI